MENSEFVIENCVNLLLNLGIIKSVEKNETPKAQTDAFVMQFYNNLLAGKLETGIPLIPQPETYQVINNNFECIGNNTNSHFNLTKAQINEKIGELVSVKREQINKSNEMEFVNIQNGECARTGTSEINRHMQMKSKVQYNSRGPLERSTNFIQHLRNPKSASIKKRKKNDDFFEYFGGRINALEEHLNFESKSETIGFATRIRFLEDRIFQIEQDFPAFAAFHFNTPDITSSVQEKYPAFRIPSIKVTQFRHDSSAVSIGHVHKIKAVPSANKDDFTIVYDTDIPYARADHGAASIGTKH